MDKLHKSPLNNKLIIALCLAGLVFAGISIIYSLQQTNSANKTETLKPQAINAVTALGRIEPQGRTIQLAPTPELGGAKIAQLLVEEGDRLVEGQTIALLDNYRIKNAALELARQEVKIAKADLAVIQAGAKQGDLDASAANIKRIQAQLEEEITANEAEVARLQAQLTTEKAEKQARRDRLQAELRNARSEFRRYQQLARDGAISQSELDARRLTLETAKKAVAEAEASYRLTQKTLEQQINQAQAVARQNKSTLRAEIIAAEANFNSVAEVRDVDLVRAEAEVDRAIAALQQALEESELTYVKAPTDGQVIKINTYPGEVVSEEGVVEFANTRAMMVVAEVYESDIGRVTIGQKATIRSETGAFTGEISGEVQQIGLKIGKQDVLNTDPAADVDSRVVEVKINLDSEMSSRVAHLTNSKVMVEIINN